MRTRIGFIGSGWRAHGYMRVIREFSHRMEVAAVLVHSAGSREKMETEYPGRVYTDLAAFLSQSLDFVMVLVPGEKALFYNAALMERGIPVLTETPPGKGVQELNACWQLKEKYRARIQVTEQCHLRPYYQAVLKLIGMGRLGTIVSVDMGILHDYHAMSIIRKCMGLTFENCEIRGREFYFPVHYHCGREGMHPEAADNLVKDHLKRGALVFETGQAAFYDFSDEQYFNYFRTKHLTVRGTLGEVFNDSVAYLSETGMPVTGRLHRDELGVYENLEGRGLRGLQLNGKTLYTNPYTGEDVRLNDDEIAMACMLDGMADYVKTGREIYPLRDALQDTYLHLMLDEAICSGETVRTKSQSWAG